MPAFNSRIFTLFLPLCLWFTCHSLSAAPLGYYRQPTIHGDTIVFIAEGDLWKVSTEGGVAMRLTSHPGEESSPAVSPDGQTLAFIGHYEGPAEVYTTPLAGGPPTRRTYDGRTVSVPGWTPDGKVIIATKADATLPDVQLVTLDLKDQGVPAVRTRLPLAQAADGCFDPSGKTLYFTRLPHQGSHTKHYKGGTRQDVWKYTDGAEEAVPLTADFAGTSKRPMLHDGRVYFASDRDGTMNLWSMKPDGGDPKQHSHHAGWDVADPALSQGRIVYQLGADLWIYDIAADRDQRLDIRLESDFDQTREHWVQKPLDYLAAAHISPDGQSVALTARGKVFVAPRKAGRFVEVTHGQGVRYRDARYLGPKDLLTLGDESGEIELWSMAANGTGKPTQLTDDGSVLRWEAVPSPDGKHVAHHDKDQRLFVYNVDTKANSKIDESRNDVFGDLRWSPDGKWLAYAAAAVNQFHQIRLYSVASGELTTITTDQFDSYSPAWSADGKWLYFLSDRSLKSVVHEPWGPYQPEPFLDKRTLVYAVALTAAETHSPFAPDDELHPTTASEKPATQPSAPTTRPAGGPAATPAATQSRPAAPTQSASVRVDLAGIRSRLYKLPLPPGNYKNLAANAKSLFWLSANAGEKKMTLMGVEIGNDHPEPKTIAPEVKGFELCQDGSSLLIVKGEQPDEDAEVKTKGLCVIDAAVAQADLAKKEIDLSDWQLSVLPRQEWRSMFIDAWRMERDYFYDRKMHGLDWKAVRAKYEPLVDRVTDRSELSDLIAQMVSELSALHIFVEGGEMRKGVDQVPPASLGAALSRDPSAGGYRVEHVYRSDPEEPERLAPLARLGVDVKEGDVIEQIDGEPALEAPDVGALLRRRGDKQVLLRVKPKLGGVARDVIVTPVSADAADDLRYREWEYTRRVEVEDAGKGQIGYVHLRAMGNENFTEWAKAFYPVWNRRGLIIDVRHNQGGNIDSWIIGRLLRKAWFYWSDRVDELPMWNMQYAFRGHVVVLCDQFTMSDGEAFTEGIKRLKLGRVIGARTWGGEIWLSFSNLLVDRGIASAAEFGVYGPEGKWLIENHGVEPDEAVDNLPHATFQGQDAQLKAAIGYLQKEIKEKPIEQPRPPAFPDKSK